MDNHISIARYAALTATVVWFAAIDQQLAANELPDGAIELFGGDETGRFVSMSGGSVDWPIEDDALVSTPNGRRSNNLVSRLHFRNADIHVEFMLPATGDGNSGVFLHGFYEIQVLNSFDVDQPTAGDAGGLYSLHAPTVNACAKPGVWQTLDVHFVAPGRNNTGKVSAPGTVSVWLNGQQIHDAAEIGDATSKYNPFEYDTTEYLEGIRKRMRATMAGPLMLQDHDCPVRFRNVWVKPLDDNHYWYDEVPPASGPGDKGRGR